MSTTETGAKVEWHYWCPNVGEHVFAPNELHVGITVEDESGILGFHTVAVLPPIPTDDPSQPEPFARAFVSGLKDCTPGWTVPDGYFAGLRARGFQFPLPRDGEHPHDVDEAVMEMVASDREEAEGRALAAEAELEKVTPWLRWIAETHPDECRYDHHGLCQAHNLDERPCPVEQVKEHLGEWE